MNILYFLRAVEVFLEEPWNQGSIEHTEVLYHLGYLLLRAGRRMSYIAETLSPLKTAVQYSSSTKINFILLIFFSSFPNWKGKQMITPNPSSEQTVFSRFMPHSDFVLSKDVSDMSQWFCFKSSSSRCKGALRAKHLYWKLQVCIASLYAATQEIHSNYLGNCWIVKTTIVLLTTRIK